MWSGSGPESIGTESTVAATLLQSGTVVMRSNKKNRQPVEWQCHESSPQLTKIAVLLTRKQHLLSRLEEHPEPNERLEIEARLDKIDAELNALDNPDRL